MQNTLDRVGDVNIFQVNITALDASTVSDFKQDLEDVINEGGKLLLDLSQVEYVDSAGLGGIVSSLKRLRASGGDVRVCGLQKAVRALFELVRLHKLLDVFNDRDEAINSFSAQNEEAASE